MSYKKLLAFAVALPVAISPVMAEAASSSLQAAAVARSASPTSDASQVAGHPSYGYFIGALILAGFLAIVLTDHHHHGQSR